MRSIIVLILAVACACGPSVASVPPPAPANAPLAPGAAPKAAVAFEIEGTLSREALPATMPELAFVDRDLPAIPAGLPTPAASCAAFANRQPTPMECNGRDSGLSSLGVALANTHVAERDAQLRGLESCTVFPLGMVRALRAELSPPACADVIVRPIADLPPAGMGGALHDSLIGLGLAGMLSRAASDPPKLTGKPSKANVKAFLKSEMMPWVRQQAVAIEHLSGVGSKLRYYGRAVVAVEAGMADMRFVEAVRSAPVPEEFEKDPELRETYLQGLEQVLGPRKRRGRDAALVGLGNLATVGVLRDPRVDRARELLSRMFGGRPMNALDALLLPALNTAAPSSPAHRLAVRLQTFYAGMVFPPEAATEPAMLRMMVEKGLSLPHRIALHAKLKTGVPNEVRLLAARARLELGQNYWRRVDFDEATRLLAEWPTASPLSPDGRLILAVALALRGGHAHAADMMVKAPLSDLGIGRVGALDAIVAEGARHAGRAAFNAALIKKLAAPATTPATYWQDLAKRFETASGLLEDARHKRLAEGYAEESAQTARAIENMRN